MGLKKSHIYPAPRRMWGSGSKRFVALGVSGCGRLSVLVGEGQTLKTQP